MRRAWLPTIRGDDGQRSDVHPQPRPVQDSTETHTLHGAHPTLEAVCEIFVTVVALVVVFALGWMLGEGHVHRQAIERGHMVKTGRGIEWR